MNSGGLAEFLITVSARDEQERDQARFNMSIDARTRLDVLVVSKVIRAVATMFKEAASDSETADAHSPVVVRSIPNEELTEADIPVERSDWSTWSGIPSFAASFNGYTYWGSSLCEGDLRRDP